MPVNNFSCRACRSRAGQIVLDLGSQPACDHFPAAADPGPDPRYPLQMWLCSRCGLAQLLDDPTVPEEPRGTEPAALVAQAADAVARTAASGLLNQGTRVAEYGSPHGGSWLSLLAERGLRPAGPAEQAEVVLDCFGLMHAADQAAALAGRAARLAPGGVLLLQYHSLDAIIAHGQWNALRHGHYAYYSATALVPMLAAAGLSARTCWSFDLYGGTVLLAASRSPDAPAGARGSEAPDDRGDPDERVQALLAAEAVTGVRDPAVLAGLQDDAQAGAAALRDWLAARAARGRTVIGYGAASRAVALLHMAGVDRGLLAAVADASPAKQGRRMPGTAIEVISPAELIARQPDEVAVFVSDLMAEVRAGYPEVEARGGQWVDVESLGSAEGAAQHASSSSTRSRARQRPRVGPILPTGKPSSSDIST